MKTRIDFVSNSSSCSFVVVEPSKFMQFVECEFDKESFCNEFNSLTVSAKVEESNRDVLENLAEDIQVFTWYGKASASIDIKKLNSLSSEMLHKIVEIEFECDDYDTENVVKLSVLKRALENYGIKVDSSQSEHKLMFDGGKELSVMAKLYALAFKQGII